MPTILRRFSRFTLHTFLLAVAVIAAVFAVVAWLTRPHSVVTISSPVVSPSGNQIALVIVRGDKRAFDDAQSFERFAATMDVRLWLVSLKNQKPTVTKAEISGGGSPLTWARDESHIVFVSGRIDLTPASNYEGLDSLDLQTGVVTPLAPAEVRTPQYSRNGSWLGYVRGSDLIVKNVRTGQHRLVQSAVSHHYWCWSPDSSCVFYIRDGLVVCQYDLQSNSERILFAASAVDEKYPSYVICSPDGTLLGYHFDNWFHTIDLASGQIKKQFPCDHYFIDFDWNATGICYVDAVDGERNKKARLMFFDPMTGKATVVATGPFAYPRWLDHSKILVRQGNTELWTYNVSDGAGARVFSGPK